MFLTERMSHETAIRYSTAVDFIEIYNEEMRSLFLLSVLLTADPEKAEQCFAGGLEECFHRFDVSPEWASLWARRIVVKHAITLIKPVPMQANYQSLTDLPWNSRPNHDNLIDAFLALPTFDRFVFVLSLLERQSDEDCFALLGCKPCDVESARARALRCLADADTGCNLFEEALQVWGDMPHPKEYASCQRDSRQGLAGMQLT